MWEISCEERQKIVKAVASSFVEYWATAYINSFYLSALDSMEEVGSSEYEVAVPADDLVNGIREAVQINVEWLQKRFGNSDAEAISWYFNEMLEIIAAYVADKIEELVTKDYGGHVEITDGMARIILPR